MHKQTTTRKPLSVGLNADKQPKQTKRRVNVCKL